MSDKGSPDRAEAQSEDDLSDLSDDYAVTADISQNGNGEDCPDTASPKASESVVIERRPKDLQENAAGDDLYAEARRERGIPNVLRRPEGTTTVQYVGYLLLIFVLFLILLVLYFILGPLVKILQILFKLWIRIGMLDSRDFGRS